ncbi:MAG: hypothetical protein QOD28_2468, partial [Acidobacteriota bacterium]|nr:hypothetical protein [Acidobacteriota bacterium]
VTSYVYYESLGKNGKLILGEYNLVAQLELEGAPVTTERTFRSRPSKAC